MTWLQGVGSGPQLGLCLAWTDAPTLPRGSQDTDTNAKKYLAALYWAGVSFLSEVLCSWQYYAWLRCLPP